MRNEKLEIRNNMTKRQLILIALLVVSVLGFAQQLHTRFDIRIPAKNTYLEQAQNVLLVNNSAIQPLTLGHPVFVEDKLIGNDTINLADAPRHMLLSMAQTLEESELFETVSVLERPINKSLSFYQRAVPTQTQLDSLMREYDADALVILGRLASFNKKEQLYDNDGNCKYLSAFQNTQWTVYHKVQTHNFLFADSLYWEECKADGTEPYIPDVKTALLDMSAYTGDLIAKTFVPQWETVDRYLYENDNKDLQAGLNHLKHYRLEEAIESFTAAQTTKNKLTKAYAVANLAVVLELKGEPKQAREQAEKAVSLFIKLKSAWGRQQAINQQVYVNELKTIYRL